MTVVTVEKRDESVKMRSLWQRLPWLAVALMVMATAAMVILGYLSRQAPIPIELEQWPSHVLRLPMMIGSVSLGALIALKRPRNGYGWLWVLFGLSYVFRQTAESYAAYAVVARPGALPLGLEVAWLADRSWFLYVTLTPFVLVLFPDGRFPSRGWRLMGWIVPLSALASLLGSSFIPWPAGAATGPFANPFVFVEEPLATTLADYWAVPLSLVFVSIVAAAVSVLRRLRRSRGEERQQWKWFTLGASFVGGLMMVNIAYASWLVLAEAPDVVPQWAWDVANQLAYVALFVGIAIAVMRYRLYDVDVVIRRTLVYGVLTTLLLSIYLATIVGLQAMLLVLTNRPQSELTTVLSTLAIASLFTPLRTRVQGFIDRRFFRRKYDAQQTLVHLGRALRSAVELDVLTEEVVQTVRETLQPEHVSLWLHSSAGEPRIGSNVS